MTGNERSHPAARHQSCLQVHAVVGTQVGLALALNAPCDAEIHHLKQHRSIVIVSNRHGAVARAPVVIASNGKATSTRDRAQGAPQHHD
jgi:hypothetical protein